MKRIIFKDKTLQNKFDEEGFVILPFLNKDEIENLLTDYKGLPKVNDEGHFYSPMASEVSYRLASQELITKHCEPLLNRILIDFRIGFCTFTTKKGKNSALPLHQHWNYVDEKEFPSVGIFCPFIDLKHKNGAMYVLLGGHKLEYNIRGTNLVSKFNDASNLKIDNLTYVPMKAGEALVFDNRIIHGSPANLSNEDRIAIGMVGTPKEAPLMHYFKRPDSGKIEKYEVEPAFFAQYSYASREYQLPEVKQFLGYEENYSAPDFSNGNIAPVLALQRKRSKFWSFFE